MWNCSSGERVLEGAERSIYLEMCRYSINRLRDYGDDPDFSDFIPLTDDRIFDNASVDQKILLLAEVTTALLDPTVEIPQLTNVREAAAYFPFAVLRFAIEEELEDNVYYHFRELIWPIFEDCREDWEDCDDEDDEDDEAENEEKPHTRSDDSELFDFIVGYMEDGVFWDRDWQMSSLMPSYLDGVEPEVEAQMGYGDDYFTARLPKATPSKVKKALKQLKNLK